MQLHAITPLNVNHTLTLSPGLSWVSPHSWKMTLTLTAKFENLGVYTLSLGPRPRNDDDDNDRKNLEFDEEPAFVNISELEHHSRDLLICLRGPELAHSKLL